MLQVNVEAEAHFPNEFFTETPTITTNKQIIKKTALLCKHGSVFDVLALTIAIWGGENFQRRGRVSVIIASLPPPLLRRLMCYDLAGLFLSCIFSGRKARWFTVTQPSHSCCCVSTAQVAPNTQELTHRNLATTDLHQQQLEIRNAVAQNVAWVDEQSVRGPRVVNSSNPWIEGKLQPSCTHVSSLPVSGINLSHTPRWESTHSSMSLKFRLSLLTEDSDPPRRADDGSWMSCCNSSIWKW